MQQQVEVKEWLWGMERGERDDRERESYRQTGGREADIRFPATH